MGLDVSHGAWHGGYISFMRWRTKIAETAEMPPLEDMEGFASHSKPIKWESLKPDPLHILLNHSDCEGEISAEDAKAIADRLDEILPLLPDEEGGGHIGNWRDKTQHFINGCRKAAELNEPLIFA